MASGRLLQPADINRSLGSGLTHRSGNARSTRDANTHSSTHNSPLIPRDTTQSKLPQPTSRVFLKPRRSAGGLGSKQTKTHVHAQDQPRASPPRAGGQRVRRNRRPSRSRTSLLVDGPESGDGDREYVRSSRVSPTRQSVSAFRPEQLAYRNFAPRSPSSFLASAPTASNLGPRGKEINPKRPSGRKIPRSSTVATPQRLDKGLGMKPIFESGVAAVGPRKQVNVTETDPQPDDDDKENASPSVLAAAARHARARSHSQSRPRIGNKAKTSLPLSLGDEAANENIRTSSPDVGGKTHLLTVNDILPQYVGAENTDAEITKAALHPRRSLKADVPNCKKKDNLKIRKKAALPRLPTQVIKHTPKPIVPRISLAIEAEESPSVRRLGGLTPGVFPSLRSQLFKRAPRLSSLRTEISGLSASISSLSAALTALPTQILKHTPPQPTSDIVQPIARITGSASNSPCISKGRARSIWTMADEIALVRSGGVIKTSKILAPCPDAHVVALCLRRRNGVEAANQEDVILQTPRRSSSIPAHLHSSRHRSRLVVGEDSRQAYPVPSCPFDFAAPLPPQVTEEDTRHVERSRWTVISVKNAEQSEVRGNSPAHLLHRNGYDAHVGATKSSLMTRAQTFMRFKFLGSRPFASKKLVGRGDSRI